MKKIIRYSLLVALLINGLSCRDEDKVPYPDMNQNIGAITLVDPNPDKMYFNALNDLALEEIEFELDVDDFDVTEIVSVDLQLVYTEKDALVDIEGNPTDSVYAPMIVGNLSTFPSTVRLTGQEIADLLGKDISDLKVGDNFLITFPILTGDGRRLTVALNSDLCNEPAQPSFGGCSFQWSISCPSDLAGEYTLELLASNIGPENFKSPMNATIMELAASYYQLSDGTLDIFGPDFPIGMRFTEVCSEISIVGPSVEYPDLVIFDQGANCSYDQATGVITFDVIYNSASCCGLAGIEYTFTATPVN